MILSEQIVRRPRAGFPRRSSARFASSAVAAAVLLTLASGAGAATRTWSAGAGAASPFWDLAPNWLGGLSPGGSGDSAFLGGFDTTVRSGVWDLVSVTGSGTLTLSGGSFAVAAASSVGALVLGPSGSLGGSGTLTAGALTLQNGAQLGMSSAPGGTTAVSGLTTFGNNVNVGFGRVLELNGDASWSGNLGTLSIGGAGGSGSSSYGASSVNLAAGKTLTVLNSANGQTISGAGNFNNAGTVVASGTTFSIATQNFRNFGTIDVKASATVALPTTFTNPGRLMGSGTFTTGTLFNNGHIAPGESPGVLRLVGNLVQGTSAALDIELEAPTSFDQLRVSGSTTLGGELNIVCFADCRFSVGQSFKVLDGASNQLTGTFASVLLSGFATGAFDVLYDIANGDVLLNVTEATTPVPEPASATLMISGLLAASWSLQRRRARSNRSPS